MVNGEAVIHVQSNQFEKIHQKNEGLVIGTFMTRRPSFDFVQGILKSTWKPKGRFIMKAYGKKSYSFQFDDEEDRAQALETGNFHIASQLLLVRPWKLFIEQDIKNMETIPIWVLFKNIPEELWDEVGFSRLGSAIGEPLFTDRKTELMNRTDTARICIEVRATSTFPETVPVVVDKKKVFKIPVEYNWRPQSCKSCKVFGHSCVSIKAQQWVQKEQSEHRVIGIPQQVAREGEGNQPSTFPTNQQVTRQGARAIVAPTPDEGAWLTPKNTVKPRSLLPNAQQQVVDAQQEPENSAADILEEDEEGEITEKQQLCVAGVKLLSSSDAVPASLNGIIEEVDLVNKRMGEFLKGNAQSAPLSSPSRTPVGKKRLTAVSLASRKSQRDISAPERLDL
ncbi:hypothetical protein ACHQM5_007081 [Ranunculus cassubicifolius]